VVTLEGVLDDLDMNSAWEIKLGDLPSKRIPTKSEQATIHDS
jgi:hypothetical protein